MVIWKEEKILDGIIREFSDELDSEEFLWHFDEEDRKVEILEGDCWRFQFDDSLPFELRPGDILMIPKGKYHRVLKGKNSLKIKITKHD